jgi:hypothetical protein
VTPARPRLYQLADAVVKARADLDTIRNGWQAGSIDASAVSGAKSRYEHAYRAWHEEMKREAGLERNRL